MTIKPVLNGWRYYSYGDYINIWRLIYRQLPSAIVMYTDAPWCAALASPAPQLVLWVIHMSVKHCRIHRKHVQKADDHLEVLFGPQDMTLVVYKTELTHPKDPSLLPLSWLLVLRQKAESSSPSCDSFLRDRKGLGPELTSSGQCQCDSCRGRSVSYWKWKLLADNTYFCSNVNTLISTESETIKLTISWLGQSGLRTMVCNIICCTLHCTDVPCTDVLEHWVFHWSGFNTYYMQTDA